MQNLLTLTILAEADRQRLARLVMDAVEAFGGNVFSTATTIEDLMRRVRDDCAAAGVPVEVSLVLDGRRLCLVWGERRETLATLAQPPAADRLGALAAQLENAAKPADSRLFRRRNEQVISDLEHALQRTRLEMEELESLLEMKKKELNRSILAAQTDSLTGLYNRGGFDIRLREAFLRCMHEGEPLCLMLLDLDHFKKVNDTHGHLFGDDYLKRMADALRASVREHVDYACRMGGDEFAIILYSDVTTAERVANKILGLMDHRVSIGIAQMQETDSIDGLLGRADSVLYNAKHRGRGRYVTDEIGSPATKVG